MKFVVNYDVLKKIYQSKNGYGIERYLIGGLCGVATGMSLCIPSWINSVQNGENIIPNVILSGTGGVITVILASKYFQKLNMESAKQVADFQLRLFVNQLHNIEVRTSLELLKDAKLNQTNYKRVYSDNDIKIPKLMQIKEITVPLTNGYEETILQEHIFGDKDYKISVGELGKKRETKLVKARMNA